MINKCRRRMNRREEYIIREITQKEKRVMDDHEEGGSKMGERLQGSERSWGF